MGNLQLNDLNSVNYKLTTVQSTLKDLDILLFKDLVKLEDNSKLSVDKDKYLYYLTNTKRDLNKIIKYIKEV